MSWMPDAHTAPTSPDRRRSVATRRFWRRLLLVSSSAGLGSADAFACAACFGKSDSAMAQGMNMGIFTLLAVVVCVLSSVAGFFIYLARRSSKTVPATIPETQHSSSVPTLLT